MVGNIFSRFFVESLGYGACLNAGVSKFGYLAHRSGAFGMLLGVTERPRVKKL